MRRAKNTRGIWGFTRRDALLMLIVGILTLAHIAAWNSLDQITGARLILDHLFDIALAGVALLLITAIGKKALSAVRTGPDDPFATLTIATPLGAGFLGTGLLALGFTVGFGAFALLCFFVAVILVCGGQFRPAIRDYETAAQSLFAVGRDPLRAFSIALFVPLAVFVIAYAATPPTDWDTLMYHLEVPAAFLRAGSIHVPEDNLHVSRTGLVNFLYVPLLALRSEAAPAILSALLAIVLGIGIFGYCRRFLSSTTAYASLATYWGATTLVLVSMTPRVDATMTLYLFSALLALMCARDDPANTRLYYVAAALLGFGFATKFQTAVYAAGLSTLIVATAWRMDRTGSAPRRVLVFGLVLSLVSAPWLLKNWALLGAPLYPLFAPRQFPPWLAELFGTSMVPPSVDPGLFDWVWDLRRPWNPGDAFLAPGRLTIEPEGRLYFTSPLVLASVPALLLWKQAGVRWLLVPAVLGLLGHLMLFPHSNPRYLLPAFVPLAVVGVHALSSALARGLGPAWSRRLTPIPLLLAVSPTLLACGIWIKTFDAGSNLTGTTSRASYLHRHPFTGELYEMVDFVQTSTQDNSRVLTLFDARGYYFRGHAVQDNMERNWALLAHLPDLDCLQGTDFTHVLVNRGSLEYFTDGGLDPSFLRWDRFRAFEIDCLELVRETEYLTLYSIRKERVRG